MGTLILAASLGLAAYFAACTIWPYAHCTRCKGDGKRRAPSRRSWRPCRRCGGTGQRRRVGTLLLVALRSTKGRHR